ncbi:MAG: peptidoglycan DD-metalloendopeptidase family protein [Erysipelotrichaceae bacterium]|nr:peptidoglycan DD-metalloendopeptidase family protein [Erysipelotrichaceae bacterium]
MTKKVIIVTLSILMCALSFVKSSTFIYADDSNGVCDFQNKETYDKEKCSEYQESEIERIEAEIEEKSKNLEEAQALANEYGEQIAGLREQINELIPQIEELEAKIEELEIKIEENEKKVEELKVRILRRMASAQTTMHFNPYLDFILGSNGFADMLRRSYGVEAITAKEEADRNELIDILNQLNADKEEFKNAKFELDAKKENLEADEKLAETMQVYFNEIVERTNEELEELREESLSHKMIISQISFDLEDLLSWDVRDGFIHPVSSSVISAGMPYYPADFGGGMHIGIDYAASYGTNILAPSDGVIIASVNGCSNDRGYNLGNRCGYVEGKGMAAGGNQLSMIMSVNGYMYGLIAFHMLDGSVHAEGSVKAGTVIGQVGSSGNSTGAHCHIELFYLGEGDPEDIVDYLNKGYRVGFNLSYTLDSLCSRRGYAPCRLDGSDYFGYGDVYPYSYLLD